MISDDYDDDTVEGYSTFSQSLERKVGSHIWLEKKHPLMLANSAATYRIENIRPTNIRSSLKLETQTTGYAQQNPHPGQTTHQELSMQVHLHQHRHISGIEPISTN
jgi:hypothetical protein